MATQDGNSGPSDNQRHLLEHVTSPAIVITLPPHKWKVGADVAGVAGIWHAGGWALINSYSIGT